MIFLLDLKRLEEVNFIYNGRPDQQKPLIGINDLNLVELCSNKDSRTYSLLPLVKEVLSYEKNRYPDFDKLRYLLEKILLDQNMVPPSRYDFILEELKVRKRQRAYYADTLEVNMGSDDISEASIDLEDFENLDEFENKSPKVNEPNVI